MPNLDDALNIATSGLRAQGQRLRVIAENIANADSVSQSPNGQPYRRKIISFKNELDRTTGAELVKLNRIDTDQSAYRLKYDPNHPSADPRGYVRLPNVNTLVEMVDMREAERSYEANLKTVEATRAMVQKTIDLLR